MSDFLSRLVQRTRGEAATVRPVSHVVTAPDPGSAAWDEQVTVREAPPLARSARQAPAPLVIRNPTAPTAPRPTPPSPAEAALADGPPDAGPQAQVQHRAATAEPEIASRPVAPPHLITPVVQRSPSGRAPSLSPPSPPPPSPPAPGQSGTPTTTRVTGPGEPEATPALAPAAPAPMPTLTISDRRVERAPAAATVVLDRVVLAPAVVAPAAPIATTPRQAMAPAQPVTPTSPRLRAEPDLSIEPAVAAPAWPALAAPASQRVALSTETAPRQPRRLPRREEAAAAVHEHTTTVEVSIGRIEVRMPPRARAAAADPASSPSRRAAVGLAEYLSARDAGKPR